MADSKWLKTGNGPLHDYDLKSIMHYESLGFKYWKTVFLIEHSIFKEQTENTLFL